MNSILSSFFFQMQGFNWVDILIIVVILFYILEGYALGFLTALADLISFILAFFAGLTFYGVFGNLLVKFLSIPQGFAKAVGFFIAAFIVEILATIFLKKIVNSSFQADVIDKNPVYKRINLWLGIIPSVFSGIILSTFILTLIATLPFSIFLKKSVLNSQIGSRLVNSTGGLSKDINNIFKGVANDGLAFLTVEPTGNESVKLNFKLNNFTVDNISEEKMFEMVNKARKSNMTDTLVLDDKLTDIARKHCKDMFRRGYFSHYTPDNVSPFDRIAQADVLFDFAGENLAFAPNVDLAMDGLMKSPGHKANIMSNNFARVGIGIIDGGIYGEMFCQEFAD
ncbi:MAG: hypothetical protein CO135_03960 [Candidatus Levybacteria bacterium CG_4_9_14_3_um_filter_35_16]|nr:MAG: hypothetical protein COY68_00855 [Candidatus Levybacteria bacterium CG_4_10_14_0_8_um_filter_35_23]PJA90839.1 MAG: hypothetical protein CO135_03960 [Candidatus Levybacteria bacterium CG_4_9_14_3_um_filter_35_16]PJC54166.1 MAG: hypothetical protein CO028_03790 [Candidatus Levybacteria bacterium CG_4_9_14_0_2_um_filter_35_21]